jgi:outer membrane protein TolC
VLDGDHAVARTVKTGFTAEHRIEILDGLDEAATVITPASSVTDGTPVRNGSFEESAIGRSLDDVDNRQSYAGFIGVRLAPAAIGRLEAAAARVEQVRLEVARVDDEITAEVVAAYDQARTAEERIAAAFRGLRAAEATEELSQVRFRGGVGISLEILDAETTLTEARTTLVAAIIGYDAAQVRLLRSLGAVSPAALLAEPNRAREGD